MRFLLVTVAMLLACCGCAPLGHSDVSVVQLHHELTMSVEGRVICAPRALVLQGQPATITIAGTEDGSSPNLDIEVTIGADGMITVEVTTASGSGSHTFSAGTTSKMVIDDQWEIELISKVKKIHGRITEEERTRY